MYNSYFSSVHCSFRGRGSVTFACNDYSHSLNQRCDRIPLSSSQCCCCCCCCSGGSTSALSTRIVPANRSLLYGLRQSNLLQWSASKRLILGGGDRVYNRVSGYGVDRGAYEVACASKGRRIGRRIRGGSSVRCLSSEEDSERLWLSGGDEVDEIINLLSEECFSGRERKGNVSRRMKVEKGGKYNESYRRNNRTCDAVSMKNDLKSRYELIRKEPGEEEFDQRERRKEALSGRKQREKKESSSCSSYYSLSSTGDVEDETEVQENLGEFVEESDRRCEAINRASHEVLITESRRDDKKSRKLLVCQEGTQEEERMNDAQPEAPQRAQVSRRRTLASTSGRRDAHKGDGILDYVESTTMTQVVASLEERVKDLEARLSKGAGESQRQKDSALQDLEHSQYKNSDSRSEGRQQIKAIAESVNQEHKYGVSKSGSSACRPHEHGTAALNEGRNYTEKSEAYGKPGPGSVRVGTSCVQFVQKEGQYKKESSRQYDFESHSSGQRRQQNEMMAATSTRKASGGVTSAPSALHSQQGVTGLHQEKYGRDERDKAYGESPNLRDSEVALGSDDHSEKSSLQFVGEFIQKEEQYRLKKSSQYNLEHTTRQEGSVQKELMSKSSMKEAPTGVSVSKSTALHYHGGTTASLQESQHREERDALHYHGEATASHEESQIREEKEEGEFLSPLTHEDALGSARNMEGSSSQFIGEFMEKARSEVSTSEVKINKLSEFVYEREHLSHQYGSEDTQYKEQDSVRASEVSGAKGPSVEMWAMTDPSAVEVPRGGEQETTTTTTTNNAVVKRHGKSLWGVIADLVRLRWASRAETPKSVGKSCGKSSSNDSAGSETWYSGREHEKSDEDAKLKRKSLPPSTSSSQLQIEESSSPPSGTMKSRDDISNLEVQTSSSHGTLEIGSANKDSSSSQEDNRDWDKNGKGPHATPSRMTVVESSLPLSVGTTTTSPMICTMERTESGRSKPSRSGSQEVTETGGSEPTLSGSMEITETDGSEPSQIGSMQSAETGRSEPSRSYSRESTGPTRREPFGIAPLQQKKQLASTRLIEVSGSGEKDGELKRRKFQRSNQLIQDRFDKWEEAYKADIRQQRIDEVFMREALLEAQKAADSWEVPVGAVLVQHGKIIARGCNLVEELRDSTAHAEMICIREASNVLKSWRLAETTLYVTLEPCPMCAGAIMQARIDTVVWGAPNKLLGADGSWIRLFPDTEGGNGSEVTGKPAAPVHPFHPRMTIRRGVLASECAEVMQQFFQLRRQKEKKVESSKEKAGTSSPRTQLPVSHHPSKFLAKMHQIFHIFCL